MIPLLTRPSPTGYPYEAGLVAYFDLMVDNLLLWSETLEHDTWTKAGAGVGSVAVVTDNYLVPGQSRIQMALNGGTAAGDQSGVLGGASAGFSRVGGFEAKTTDGSTKVAQWRVGDTSSLITITGEWQEFSRTSVDAAGTVYLWLRGTMGTSDSADIIVRKARVNPGTSLRDYVATTDLQTLASLYGKSPTLQRGATSGAEASDGTLVATGWQAVTDDYLKSGAALSDVTLAGPWTAIVVADWTSTGATQKLFSLAVDSANIVQIRKDGATPGDQTVAVTGGGGSSTSPVGAFGAGRYPLVVTMNAGIATLSRPGTALSVATTVAYTPTGAAKVHVGAGLTTTPCDSLTAVLVSVHNSILSTAQITRAVRAMRARAAVKGVVVS